MLIFVLEYQTLLTQKVMLAVDYCISE